MTVAIIDYGSGNLHSAQKAFERAAREAGMNRDDPGHLAARGRARRRARRAARASGPSPTAGAGLTASPAWSRRWMRRCASRASLSSASASARNCSATRGLEHEVVAGLNWIPGDVAAIKPCDPALKIPHMGWNTLDVKRPHRAAGRDPDRARRPACLFRAFLPALSGTTPTTSSRPPTTAAR